MTKEITPAKNSLNPSIFKEKTFIGKEVDVFGKIGAITRVGDLYSLNLGRGEQNGRFRLVVLDAKAKTLTGYIFDDDETFLQREVSEWNVEKYSFEPNSVLPRGVNYDALFSRANDFITKTEELLPSLEEKEQKNVRAALHQALRPLRSHYEEQMRHIHYIVDQISRI